MGLIVRDIRKRWPGGCVPYVIADPISQNEERSITLAINRWEELADVRFVRRTGQDRYLKFIPDAQPLDGTCSSSSVGMAGGEQTIKVDPRIGYGIILHEIGHALGFHHEHKRPDRDRFIKVHTDEIKGEHKSQFEKVSDAEAISVGGYDLDSVMHYSPIPEWSQNGHTDLIKTNDTNDQSRIGQRNTLSPTDIDTARDLNRGNSHVYQLSTNGQIETVVDQNNWTQGWTTALTYSVGAGVFLFLLKHSDGKMHINQVNFDGSIGPLIDNQDWSSEWSAAVVYSVGISTNLLLYKASNGRVDINRIEMDGKVGDLIDGGEAQPGMEAGWTSIEAYSVGLGKYMVFSSPDNSHAHVHVVEWDGKLGPRKQDKQWGPGWSVVKPFSVWGQDFILTLSTESGRMKVRRLKADGTIGAVIQSQEWTKGWTTAIPYEVLGNTYLFLLKKDTGDVHINQINGDGKIGNITDVRRFNQGWGTASCYSCGAGKFIILIKP